MKLVFLGTPAFAVPTLEALAAAGHDIAAVVTQPDRPKGRGHQLSSSPVKEAALRMGLPVEQPLKIRDAATIDYLARLGADAMVVVGYGQIIPQRVIDLPRYGIINVHASLLPKYRGAAPIQWAIANGEQETGVTTMQIDAGLDTGDILLAERTPIYPTETAPQLASRLAVMGAALAVRTLTLLEAGKLTPVKQDDAAATYAPMLKKEDGLADWRLPARAIYNRWRGFQPWPGCFSSFRGSVLHLVELAPPGADPGQTAGREPGALLARDKRLWVVCGDNTCLEILQLQLEGRKKMDAASFLNGVRLSADETLGGKLA